MKFYCIAYPSNQPITELLKSACQARDIEYVEVNPAEYNYANPVLPAAGDILYRASPGQSGERAAIILERFMMHDQVATLYQEFTRSLVGAYSNSYIFHQKAGLPIPKTINHLTRDRAQLKQYVEHLGGFPIVLKVLGGSHGVGVIQVDSLPALYSLIDYLPLASGNIIMRQFIKTNSHARLIVLGDKVIDSIKYNAPADDFRTNTGDSPAVEPYDYPADIKKLAAQSVKVLGVEFGGVDIMINDQDHPFITEVNFPCNFARSQHATGTNIAGLIVDHLMAKSPA